MTSTPIDRSALPGPGQDGTAPLRRRHRWHVVVALLCLAAVAAVLVADLHFERARIAQESEQRLLQQARLLDQVLARQIEAVNAALASVVQDLPSWAEDGPPATTSRHLAALDAAVTGTRTFVLTDASGTVYAASRAAVVGLSVADREFFAEARGGNDPGRLYVSPPFRSVLGIWSLNLSRVLRQADGSFAGIVSATLDPAWLAVTLGAVNFAPDMWTALAHGGGRLLLMSPMPTTTPIEGVDLAVPGSMYLRHRDSGLVETVFRGRITASGQGDRLIVQRTVQSAAVQAPQALTLGLSRDLGAVYAGWRSRALNQAVFFALLATLLGAGLALMQRAERRASQVDAAARLALQAQEQRWLLALESSGLGVWDADLRSGHVYRSRGWWALLGGGADVVEEQVDSWRSRLHPDDAAEVERRFADHVAGRTPAYQAEYRLRAADGSYRWMLSRGASVERDAAGQALRVVGTMVDVTDQHEAETLRSERDRAAAESRAKSEFVSRMSHEMRTPLNAVLGFAQMLSAGEGRLPAEEQLEYAQRIEEGGWNLLALVDHVLDLARVESGQLALELQPVPLAPLVQRAADDVAARAQGLGLHLQVAPVPEGAVVLADALRLREVLAQLLSNAVKYNRPGGEVSLSVSLCAGPGRWCITVGDTGIGIAFDVQDHLFEPFNRLGHENSAIEGTGLGLVLARWYVKAMGGRLDVHSEQGVGSRFTVELAAADSRSTPAP